MNFRNVFYVALFSFVLLLGVNGTSIAYANDAQGNQIQLANHSVEVQEENNETAYPINEDIVQQSSSLGVNRDGNDSYPFVYNVIIGALVLGIILFLFRKKSVKN